MILLNDNILVSELQDDLMYNGTVVRYDSDNPYMICHVEEVSDEAKNVSVGNIIVIKRYAKEEYLPVTNKNMKLNRNLEIQQIK